MKKILLLVTACMLLSLQGFAQFGVKAGLNFNSFGDIKLGENSSVNSVLEKKTGFHAGVLYKFKIPVIGLALQPELIYSKVNGNISLQQIETPSFVSSFVGTKEIQSDVSVSYLQLPVAVQMGLDLVLLRPFIQVVPYIGYAISTDVKIKDIKLDTEKLNYGIGVGAGIDIWKLQISGRYNWDLGKVADYKWEGIDTFKGGKGKGFQLSLAFLF